MQPKLRGELLSQASERGVALNFEECSGPDSDSDLVYLAIMSIFPLIPAAAGSLHTVHVLVPDKLLHTSVRE